MPNPKLEEIDIQAKNIDAAATEIIGVLEDTSKGNMIYFDGWHGFGASAALKVVAQRLKSSKSKFDKVIHVDCSVWKSMRALQKAVAEELELPQYVMDIFDRCDEDDDFKGIDEGSREVIGDIRREIFKNLASNTFVVIFLNGGSRYIDFYECGVPAIPFLTNTVLWTWHGRFRLDLVLDDVEQEKVKMHTNVCLRTSLGYVDKDLQDLVHEEAEEVAKCTMIVEPGYMNHKIVNQCFLYGCALRNIFCRTCNYSGSHVPNYWVCDGIIQGQGNTSAWEIGNSLQRNIHLDWVGKMPINLAQTNEAANHLAHLLMRNNDVDDDCWVYMTHQDLLWGDAGVLPPSVRSFFFFADEPLTNITSVLPVSMPQHSENNNLHVLYLSCCTFSFATPPFIYCGQLRLLHLDHCTNTDQSQKGSITDEEYQSHNENISCFQKLWVLDLRYTDWYWLLSEKMMSLMADLKELNVEGVKNWSITEFCGGSPSLVILPVTANTIHVEDKKKNSHAALPSLSNAGHLETLSLDSCLELEQVGPDMLPASLEAFSFVNSVASIANISSISFHGCSKLKSVLLRGNLGILEELDLSGTAVKTLDLREVEAPNLKRLILVGTEKLRAILWPIKGKMTLVLEKLHINTIRSASPSQKNCEAKTKEASAGAGSSSILTFGASPQGTSRTTSFEFSRYIAVVDPRLIWSLVPFQRYIQKHFVYMETDSSSASGAVVGGREVAQGMGSQQITQYLYAREVFREDPQAVNAIEGVISWMWACPPNPTPSPQDWYFHMQDEDMMERGSLQRQRGTQKISTGVDSALVLMCDNARMLYVHDSSSTTCIPCPQDSDWSYLEWCRVERCPNLCSVFATPQPKYSWYTFLGLRTLWASQLLKACYIWNWSTISTCTRSFGYLVFLHLDCCPRLKHVIPLLKYVYTLPSLETLEIVCCGDLKEVFPVDLKRQENQEIVYFANLRRIHLYELPMLHHICGSRMSAPKLETVKIRGCWSLMHLPAVSGDTSKRPKVDCEKEWWDNLEWLNWRYCYWDRVETKHDPSLYEPSHSRYYKKADLPRGTLLR